MSALQLWMMAFPVDYLRDVVLPEINEVLEVRATLQEVLCHLGCFYYMACFTGIDDRRKWWSRDPPSMRGGAPFRLNEYMSGARFQAITTAYRLTNLNPPEYIDKFFEIRQLQDAFNKHYETNYNPGWWNCVDESISVWLDKFCPGFMCVPRKPHPFGNEYHTICDGFLDGGYPIMWRAMIQEGKDRPPELGPKKFSENGPTCGVMMRMVEPLRGSGKCVTGDSGFSVSQGCVEMDRKLGVYGQFLVKKRGRYWPKGVPGDMIEEHFKDKPIGHSETWETTFDGHPFFVHCTKGEVYG
jgi:hypothetical protein